MWWKYLLYAIGGAIIGAAITRAIDQKAIAEAYEAISEAERLSDQATKSAISMMDEAIKMANANDPLRKLVKHANNVAKMG